MNSVFKFTVLIGSVVWVRTASGDVYFGALADKNGKEVALYEAYRILSRERNEIWGPLEYVELTDALEVTRCNESDKVFIEKLILDKGKS